MRATLPKEALMCKCLKLEKVIIKALWINNSLTSLLSLRNRPTHQTYNTYIWKWIETLITNISLKVRLKHCVCFLVRYPESQNCEGEKHQPGFVSQGPVGTEACWDGGQGTLIKCVHCSTDNVQNDVLQGHGDPILPVLKKDSCPIQVLLKSCRWLK